MMERVELAPGSEASREKIAAVVTALEPDQLVAVKERHRFARRELTRMETAVFWALRAYLLFMVGVVMYQIWVGTR